MQSRRPEKQQLGSRMAILVSGCKDGPALAEGRRVVGKSEGALEWLTHTHSRARKWSRVESRLLARTPRIKQLGLSGGRKEKKLANPVEGWEPRTYIMHRIDARATHAVHGRPVQRYHTLLLPWPVYGSQCNQSSHRLSSSTEW